MGLIKDSLRQKHSPLRDNPRVVPNGHAIPSFPKDTTKGKEQTNIPSSLCQILTLNDRSVMVYDSHSMPGNRIKFGQLQPTCMLTSWRVVFVRNDKNNVNTQERMER